MSEKTGLLKLYCRAKALSANHPSKMVQAVLEGKEPQINDETTYNNNKLVVPSYLCNPVPVDAENYKQELIGSGYYTEADLQ
jgi:putative multiple sugar transport system substrate-binding protein